VAKATFPLATSETYTNKQGETITSTEWHNIVLWRALAEVAEKTVRKGSLVYIVGMIKTRSYVDKDGVNKYITEILADTLLLLERKNAPATSSAPTESSRGITPDKNNSAPVVNEPPASYNPTNENNGRIMSDKGNLNNEESDADIKPENPQNEDDLPF
jgi:single-strand DNA-binding protein